MNTLIVFAAVIAVALADGQVVSVSQSSLGDYDFKYATAAQSRSEHRNVFGQVNGAYSYVDPYGLLRKVAYTADEHGFRAIGNNIPLPVQDTPEVALTKADHLLRKGFVPEIVETPIVAPAKVVEISQPLARSYIETVPVATESLVRIAHNSPTVLDLSAHVARSNHFLI